MAKHNDGDGLAEAIREELAGIEETTADLGQRLSNGAPARPRARALGELEKVRAKLAKLLKALPAK